MVACECSVGANRDYGQTSGRPYVKIGRGVLYLAIREIVKTACHVQATDQNIEKAIREGVNTIRLHDKEVRLRRQLRMQQSDPSDQLPRLPDDE